MSRKPKGNARYDGDIKDCNGNWLRCWSDDSSGVSIQYHTLSGIRWQKIQERCKEGGWYQDEYTSYVGCKNMFEDFQEFTEWSTSEAGYTQKDVGGRFWALDKDLLSKGKSVYSPETCVFVPSSVNGFLALKPLVNKAELHGVSWTGSKFLARIISEGKRKSLGYYFDPFDAHKAWQKAKLVEAVRLMELFSSKGEIPHRKVYEGLGEIVEKLSADIKNEQVTNTLY